MGRVLVLVLVLIAPCAWRALVPPCASVALVPPCASVVLVPPCASVVLYASRVRAVTPCVSVVGAVAVAVYAWRVRSFFSAARARVFSFYVSPAAPLHHCVYHFTLRVLVTVTGTFTVRKPVPAAIAFFNASVTPRQSILTYAPIACATYAFRLSLVVLRLPRQCFTFAARPAAARHAFANHRARSHNFLCSNGSRCNGLNVGT